MPLPFRLDHVNVYLIQDGEGFVLVDTGLDNAITRETWQALFAGPLLGRRLTAVISTHWHPDHIGLAGWLAEREGVKIFASQSDYLDSRCMRLDPNALDSEDFSRFLPPARA